MTDQHFQLFDGEDVDLDGSVEEGPEGADDTGLTAAELAGIAASKADPGTSGPDAEGN